MAFTDDYNKVAAIQDSLSKPQVWVEFQHPEYIRRHPKWRFGRDHYTGEALDSNNVRSYLFKREQGESEQSYMERIRLADFPNHFASVVDSLAGMMFQVEGDANRTYTVDASDEGNPTFGPMGDPEDPASEIARLDQDADGDGNGLMTLMKMLTTELIVSHRYWVYVDGGKDGIPHVKLIQPEAITNWRYVGKTLVEVVLKEQVDTRKSIQDSPDPQDRYIVFDQQGWARYRVETTAAKEAIVVKEEAGQYEYIDPSGNPALPIFMVDLPMQRDVGYVLAWKQNILFNKESERDHLLRVANFPKLVISADETNYETIRNLIREGANMIQEDPAQHGGGHRYIHPSSESAQVATTVLERKVEEYYTTAFRDYGQHARQKTATEAKQDLASGVGAFLQMLKEALDDAENAIYWRIEQTLKPKCDPVAHVERSDEFLPTDIESTITNLGVRYNGSQTNPPLPVGRTAKIAALKQILTYDGIEYDQSELEAAVDSETLLALVTANPSVQLPAEVRIALLAKLCAAFQLVDPDQVVEMADGEKKNLLEIIMTQALQNEQMKDQAALLKAQTMPAGSGAPGAPAGGTGGRPPAPNMAKGFIKTKTSNRGGVKPGKGQRGGVPSGNTGPTQQAAPHLIYPPSTNIGGSL